MIMTQKRCRELLSGVDARRKIEILNNAIKARKNKALERCASEDFNLEKVKRLCIDSFRFRLRMDDFSNILWKGNIIDGGSIMNISRKVGGVNVIRGPADASYVLRLLKAWGITYPIEFSPSFAAPWLGLQYEGKFSSLERGDEGCEGYWTYKVLVDVVFGSCSCA